MKRRSANWATHSRRASSFGSPWHAAVLRDPSLYIIEEPTEQLDKDTKDLVDDTLGRVLPGKTVVYLPHRMSTLRECDKIYLLHEGRIVAVGEHRELMAENELYRHLYYLEFNPFAETIA